MKISLTVLLLAISSVCLLHSCKAGVVRAPEDLQQALKATHHFATEDDDNSDNSDLEYPPSVDEEEEEDGGDDQEEEGLDDTGDDDYDVDHRSTECDVPLRKGLATPQPVFLQPGTEEFFPFSETGSIHLRTGQSLEMWCDSKSAVFPHPLMTATCVGGSIFRVQHKNRDLRKVICNKWPNFVAQRTGEECEGGMWVRVGFEISSERFVEQMRVCFNEEEQVTRYVHHKLYPGSHYYQNNVKRLPFQTADFFDGKNVDHLYSQAGEKDVLNQQGVDGDTYIDRPKSLYLSRGHMAAKADFAYGAQQRATFLFINTAPQWQVFNAGNWVRVEDGVRAWVSKHKMNVDCYTGVYGVTTLPNTDGVETPLYLSRDENNNGLIPVPKIYFRIVIEPATGRGIVFVGVNNPYLSQEQIDEDYILCEDVSDKVNYIKWKRDHIKAGYSYACEVEDFLKAVENAPQVSAPGGLLV